MEFPAFPNWPEICDEDLVAQGSRAQSLHAQAIETAMRHLCGMPWHHGTAQCGYGANFVTVPQGSGQIVILRPYLLPFARAVEVAVLCDGQADVENTNLAYTVTMGGATHRCDKPIAGLTSAYGDDDDTIATDWNTFVFEVGDGSATAGGYYEITMECHADSQCQQVQLFAVSVRQLPNLVLSQP